MNGTTIRNVTRNLRGQDYRFARIDRIGELMTAAYERGKPRS